MENEKKKPFVGIDHGTGRIDLTHLKNNLSVLRPVEIHHKSDGSIKNGLSFCIVMMEWPVLGMPRHVSGEISLEMLNNGLNDIGYTIIKK